jgi:hypothetical protein
VHGICPTYFARYGRSGAKRDDALRMREPESILNQS